MLTRFASAVLLAAALAGVQAHASSNDETEIRDFIARWNAAYTGLDAAALAAMETPDFQLVDRFGHWIKSEGPEFNQRLWALTFRDIYHGKPGPARTIESIRMLAPQAAIVQARANHADGVTLDDGTHIPPFWEIDTYTLVRTAQGWRLALLNIHNQINPGTEGAGQHVPNASTSTH
jgi:ketosteroid isomerase-like protein